MPVLPAIDLEGDDSADEELPMGDFVTEQEMNQQDIENELCEDAEPAEAAGSSAPEAGAVAMV
eukprot:16437235-Heterocapsa_arctica.AAC.1